MTKRKKEKQQSIEHHTQTKGLQIEQRQPH